MKENINENFLKIILILIFSLIILPISFGFFGTALTSFGYYPNLESEITF